MTLLELQQRMSEDVRRPLTSDFNMQTVTDDGRPVAPIVETYAKPNSLLSSFERVEIYNRQYWFRVIAAVSEDYPALAAVLGEKRFDALILAYLKENPSTSFTLRDLGGKLPVWLADHPEFAGGRSDLAVDVARLEWAYIEAFDGASLPALTPADFASLLPASTLSLQPHLQLLELRYPVDEIVLAVRRNTPEAEVASNAVTERAPTVHVRLPGVRRARTWLAVHRFEDSVYYRRIEREVYTLLTAIRAGNSIAEAVGSTLAASRIDPHQQALNIREYFAHAAELGWFAAPPHP